MSEAGAAVSHQADGGVAADGAGCRVDLGEAGSFHCPPDEPSLLRAALRAALRAGLTWPYECQVGGCGACRYELQGGVVEELWSEAPGLSARDRARGRRLACQTRPAGDLQVKLRLGPAAEAAGGTAGLPQARRQAVRLVRRRVLSADMTEFSFTAQATAHFLAGQYALFDLPGVTGPRAYSMSNLANTDGLWQFIVRRTPAGQGSRVLFDELAEGPSCMMDGPYGHAYARTGVAREAVCVAGGSGLAPVLSICRALLAVPEGPGLRVYLGLRRQADLGVAADLQALALAHKRLKLTVVLSEPDPGAATARSGDQTWQGATGYVHEVVERELGAQAAQMEHYFAGPPPMINAMQDFLMLRAKVPPGQIHFDRFV